MGRGIWRSPGDNKFLYVLNELSGCVAQYAIDGANGTLKLIASVPSVPPELGMKWGQPQVPAGAGAAAPATAPKADEKPAIWAADLRLTTERKIPLHDRAQHRQDRAFCGGAGHGHAHLRYQLRHRAAAARHQHRSERALSGRLGREIGRLSVYRIDQASGKLSEPTRYPVGKGANWIEIVELK